MKFKHILLVALLGFFASSAFSAPVYVANAENAEKPPVSTKDQFLQFLADKAMTYTDKVEDAIGASIDFAKKEAEPTMREFLVWRAWKHGMIFAMPFSVFLFGISLVVFCWKGANLNPDKYNFNVRGGLVWLGFALAFIFGLIACINLDDLFSFIQIQVAPRIYLIEEVSKLIR